MKKNSNIKIVTEKSKSIPDYIDLESLKKIEINEEPFILVGKNNSGKSTLLEIISDSKTKFTMEDKEIKPIVLKVDSNTFSLYAENNKSAKLGDLLNQREENNPSKFYLSQLSDKISSKLDLNIYDDITKKISGEYDGAPLDKSGTGINKLIYINWLIDKADLIYNFELNKSIEKFGIEKLIIEVLSNFFENGEEVFTQIYTYLKTNRRRTVLDGMHVLRTDSDAVFPINSGAKIGARFSLDNSAFRKAKKINEHNTTMSTLNSRIYEYLIKLTNTDGKKEEIKNLRGYFAIISDLFEMLLNKRSIASSTSIKFLEDLKRIDTTYVEPDKIIFIIIDEPENSLQESFRNELSILIKNILSKITDYDFRFIISTHSENMVWHMRDFFENIHISYKSSGNIMYKNIFGNSFDEFYEEVKLTIDKMQFTSKYGNYDVSKDYVKYLITQTDSLKIFFMDEVLLVEGYDDKLIFESMGYIVIATDGYMNLIIFFLLMSKFVEHFSQVDAIIDLDVDKNEKLLKNNLKIIEYLNEDDGFLTNKFNIFLSKYKDIYDFAKSIDENLFNTKKLDPFILKSNHNLLKNKTITDVVIDNYNKPAKVVTFNNLIKTKKPSLGKLFNNKIVKISEDTYLLDSNSFLDYESEIIVSKIEDSYRLYTNSYHNGKTTTRIIISEDEIQDWKVVYNPLLMNEWNIYNVERNISIDGSLLLAKANIMYDQMTLEKWEQNTLFPFDEESKFWFKKSFMNIDEWNNLENDLTIIDNFLVIEMKQIEFDDALNRNSYSLVSVIKDSIHNLNE